MRQNINGVEIHYVKNVKTGEVDDFKFKAEQIGCESYAELTTEFESLYPLITGQFALDRRAGQELEFGAHKQ